MAFKLGERPKRPKGRKPTKKRLARSKAVKHAKKTMAGFQNPDGSRKQSNIEAKMETILRFLGVFYVPEYKIFFEGKCRFYDFMVTDGRYKLLVECDGDYHHATAYREGKTAYKDLTKHQRRNVRNDQFKDRIAKTLGIPLLRFTEKEIKTSMNLVAEKITQEIVSQGGVVVPVIQKQNT